MSTIVWQALPALLAGVGGFAAGHFRMRAKIRQSRVEVIGHNLNTGEKHVSWQ